MDFSENIYSFIEELNDFKHELDFRDYVWRVIFQKKKKWHYMLIRKYDETYYVCLIDGDEYTLELQLRKNVKAVDEMYRSSTSRYYDPNDLQSVWGDLITAAREWLNETKKDWIKTNTTVQRGYPLDRRTGIAPNAIIRALVPDLYHIDQELGETKTKQFISIVESRYFHEDENFTLPSLCADDFFEYCKIAYIAGARNKDEVDKKLSGREMYKRYADGRHEGLLDIKGNSKKEFAEWIDGKHPKKSGGGHPWEIKRGGNTTHIDLFVHRPRYKEEGFQIGLRGRSIGRLKETICMFLALHDAKMPITINDPEAIRLRLLAQDNIGIIAKHNSLHRANQDFREDQKVYDVLHLSDLGKQKARIKPFITWRPLPVLQLK